MRLISLGCIITIAALALASCNSQKKAYYYYLENVTDTSGKTVVRPTEPVIQKNDLLSIQVYSAATDPKVDVLYNLVNANSSSTGSSAIIGFLVDQNGNIEYPRIGKIYAEGLTKEQLTDTTRARVRANEESIVTQRITFALTFITTAALLYNLFK